LSHSLVFAWRQQARAKDRDGESGSVLLPVEIGAVTTTKASKGLGHPSSEPRRRRSKSSVIEIQLGSGSRLRVDNEVDADALRRVLRVLSEQ